LITTDPEEQMPPPKLGRTLSQAQRETIRQWIASGAGWGRHWAFEPVVRSDARDGARNPIDLLVERKLSPLGLTPAPSASRETLLRRITLDLTGLPPTPEATAKFLADTDPGAWDRLVDRVLASPAFGERMAWDWLDAARYADTNGYQGDNERTMFPWRDWVVRAFNENLPYDQFTVWQLAGDLLPNPTREQILATAFNRNHMINGEGGRIAEENRVDYVMDMTETMGTIWLGLTLNCCRCHDHKFDPLLQREYYQFTAFFNQTPVTGAGGNAQTPPVQVWSNPELDAALAAAQQTLDAATLALKADETARWPAGSEALQALPVPEQGRLVGPYRTSRQTVRRLGQAPGRMDRQTRFPRSSQRDDSPRHGHGGSENAPPDLHPRPWALRSTSGPSHRRSSGVPAAASNERSSDPIGPGPLADSA
jgi:hypothetical protein